MTRQNMLDREHSLRFDALGFWRGLYGRGLGFALRSNVKISGLGIRLVAPRPGDHHLAREISKGKFNFAGVTLSGLPHRLFDLTPPTPAWQACLHSLSWLTHFVASGQELHRIVARLLVKKWSENYNRGLESGVHCRALISLSLAAHFLVDSSQTYGTEFFGIVESHMRRVLSLRPSNANDRLLQNISLQYASLAFRTPLSMRDDANTSFAESINKVILPDGGHMSRDPLQLVETLLNVIPLRDAMLAHHLPLPKSLSAAIERMVPMLRMLSHGDQCLANFQGAGSVTAGSVRVILETDRVHGRPLLVAPHSGYCRLAQRAGVLIVDVGLPARCNSPLALEFSDGQHRIFSNCGMPLAATPAWQQAASSLAAHNTVEIDGFSSTAQNSPFAEVINSPRGSLAKCQNQIIDNTGEIKHERDLFLSQDGRDLRGEDRVSPTGRGFTLRFHLHPTIKASAIRNGAKIVLVLPNRAAWSFSARGGTVSLEDSVFLGDEVGPRKTQQIVIRCSPPAMSSVKWALRRVERATAPESELSDAPQLPF
jgi:uncharacterized heparinase superfamily protein